MKKSRPSEPKVARGVLEIVAGWATTWARFGIGLVALLMLGLLLTAWRDPQRQERHQREADELLAAKIRSEAALAAKPLPVAKDGVTEITFKSLEFIPIAEPKNPQTGATAFAGMAPPRITVFDQKRVRISGFVLPLSYEGGRVREFLILANQMTCCFGRPPRFCDYILARANAGSDSPKMDLPTAFEGTLHVRDVYAGGDWSALYSMDCTKISSGL